MQERLISLLQRNLFADLQAREFDSRVAVSKARAQHELSSLRRPSQRHKSLHRKLRPR
jgi:hypothetical protein